MENVSAIELAGRMLRDVRPLFYLELPSTSSFQHLSDVPDYVKQVHSTRDHTPSQRTSIVDNQCVVLFGSLPGR